MGRGVGLFNYLIYITNVQQKKKKKKKKPPNKVSIIAEEICIFSAINKLLQKKYVFLAHTFIKNLSKF